MTEIDKHSSLLSELITAIKSFVLQAHVLLNPAWGTLHTFYQFQGFNYIREQCDRKIGKSQIFLFEKTANFLEKIA